MESGQWSWSRQLTRSESPLWPTCESLHGSTYSSEMSKDKMLLCLICCTEKTFSSFRQLAVWHVTTEVDPVSDNTTVKPGVRATLSLCNKQRLQICEGRIFAAAQGWRGCWSGQIYGCPDDAVYHLNKIRQVKLHRPAELPSQTDMTRLKQYTVRVVFVGGGAGDFPRHWFSSSTLLFWNVPSQPGKLNSPLLVYSRMTDSWYYGLRIIMS